MITTLDGVTVKRGQTVWEIGVSIKGVYKPTMSRLYSHSNGVTNPNRCWRSYLSCEAECDRLNVNRILKEKLEILIKLKRK